MKNTRKYHLAIALSAFVFFGCTKEVAPEYSPWARLLGTWDLGVKVTSTPIVSGVPVVEEFSNAITFSQDSKGTYYGFFKYDFLWVVEEDPDIVIISQFHPGFPIPTYSNKVYELLLIEGCCDIRLRREYRDTVGGIEKDIMIDWMMTR